MQWNVAYKPPSGQQQTKAVSWLILDVNDNTHDVRNLRLSPIVSLNGFRSLLVEIAGGTTVENRVLQLCGWYLVVATYHSGKQILSA